MNWEALAVLVPTGGAILAVYIGLNGQVMQLKGRVKHLEIDRDETKTFIREVREQLEAIRIMLAKDRPCD